MPFDIYKNSLIISRVQVISDAEESKYSDIPGWEGEYVADTDKAVMLHFPANSSNRWFPYSQLRKAEDDQSIYASDWFLNKIESE